MNDKLKWVHKHDGDGIVLPWSQAKFKNLKFSIHENGRIQITGSLHKFWNNGDHNYNDFNVANLKKCIEDLQDMFDINPYTARLSNLEYGVNLVVPFQVSNFIKSIFCYRFKGFNLSNNGSFFGKYLDMAHYKIKIYDKGKQFHRSENILRIEKCIKKMEILSSEPLYLVDLLNPKIQRKCFDQILKVFDNILFNETLKINALTVPEKKNYELVANESCRWLLFDKSKSVVANVKKRSETKRKYIDIISKYGREQYRPLIVLLMVNKFISLTKNGDISTVSKEDKKGDISTYLIHQPNVPLYAALY
ncbi:MAG: hypothetical protein JKY70_09365 [Mucilaginibacter sp.]|nr:hypothetical protein [Mucilaginibacter sp.]